MKTVNIYLNVRSLTSKPGILLMNGILLECWGLSPHQLQKKKNVVEEFFLEMTKIKTKIQYFSLIELKNLFFSINWQLEEIVKPTIILWEFLQFPSLSLFSKEIGITQCNSKKKKNKQNSKNAILSKFINFFTL